MPFRAPPCGCIPKLPANRSKAMWSAQQQSMLNAMGYTLYVRPQSRPARVMESAPLQQPLQKTSPDSPLFAAIMKLVNGRDVSQLGIDVNALRSSPQAKRALWPQLRRMMKS